MTPLEHACRQAGRLPKIRRRYRDRQVARAFRRQESVSRKDLRAVVAYLCGELDPAPHRPVNVWTRLGQDARADIVRQVRRELKCRTLREAIEATREILGNPDDFDARKIWKRLTR